MQFRKKPVVIEAELAAVLIVQSRTDWQALPSWFHKAYERGDLLIRSDGIDILTLEGTMTALPGDWIICGVKGELYPCKPDIFAATYEEALATKEGA